MKLKPIFLYNMRVERTYTGGKLLDQWQGINPAIDGWKPEEWVSSITPSRYAEDPNTGLSIIKNRNLDGILLKDYLSKSPKVFLGENHYNKYGLSFGFLMKIIDSDNRLNIQTHPDREHAKLYFDSDYGKTEAWYVMDTRIINDEEPYILLGFKVGITKKKWVELIEKQDIPGMLECLHKLPVKKGDVFIIESGVPHAIGAGCMIAEIQEPTDFTFRVEKISSPGKVFPEETYHQGIGYEKMYNCFDYKGYTKADVISKMKLPSIIQKENENFIQVPIVKTENTPFFSMEKLTVKSRWDMNNNDTFCVVYILNGSGSLVCNNEEFNIKKGDELFIPNSIDKITFINEEDVYIELLISYPPDFILQ
ncbi:MAG: hypothetical protein OCD02_18410 [Spirochaetaceae bacterium]